MNIHRQDDRAVYESWKLEISVNGDAFFSISFSFPPLVCKSNRLACAKPSLNGWFLWRSSSRLEGRKILSAAICLLSEIFIHGCIKSSILVALMIESWPLPCEVQALKHLIAFLQTNQLRGLQISTNQAPTANSADSPMIRDIPRIIRRKHNYEHFELIFRFNLQVSTGDRSPKRFNCLFSDLATHQVAA